MESTFKWNVQGVKIRKVHNTTKIRTSSYLKKPRHPIKYRYSHPKEGKKSGKGCEQDQTEFCTGAANNIEKER